MSSATAVVLCRRKPGDPSPEPTREAVPLPKVVRCERCRAVVASVAADGRLKFQVRSRVLAVRHDGKAEINCHACRASTTLPLRLDSAPA